MNKLVEKCEVDHDGALLKLNLGEGRLVLSSESVGKYLVPLRVLTLNALGPDEGFLAGFSVNKFNLDESVDLLGREDIFLVSEGSHLLVVFPAINVFGIVLIIRESNGNVSGSDYVEEHLAFSQALI